MFKCKISGVRKKKVERKVLKEKKRYWVEILLSSYSLVGLFMLILQVKVKIAVGNKENDCGCRARA
jgi:hypothetical protein